MSTWATVLVGAASAFAVKYLGYLVPARWLAGGRTTAVTTLIPAALLSALVAVQTFTGTGGRLTIDARAIGLGLAAALYWKRVNFLVVIVAAGAVVAAARALGMP